MRGARPSDQSRPSDTAESVSSVHLANRTAKEVRWNADTKVQLSSASLSSCYQFCAVELFESCFSCIVIQCG